MQQIYLTRNSAAKYLKERYGQGAPRTLAKYAVLGGGPAFRKMGRAVLYIAADLDAWAMAKISAPIKSTSEI